MMKFVVAIIERLEKYRKTLVFFEIIQILNRILLEDTRSKKWIEKLSSRVSRILCKLKI